MHKLEFCKICIHHLRLTAFQYLKYFLMKSMVILINGTFECCMMKPHSTLQLTFQKLPLVEFGSNFLRILKKKHTHIPNRLNAGVELGLPYLLSWWAVNRFGKCYFS